MKIDEVKIELGKIIVDYIKSRHNEVFTASEMSRILREKYGINKTQGTCRHHLLRSKFKSVENGNEVFFGVDSAIDKLQARLK